MENKQLWSEAEERVAFRRHLYVFLFVNALFWLIWLASNQNAAAWSFPWPIYPLVAWGIALAVHYYNLNSGQSSKAVQNEYNRLKNTRVSNFHEDGVHLFNSAVVGENPEGTFIIEDGKLHAIDPRLASLRRSSGSDQIIPTLKSALRSLVTFSEGKVPPQLVRIDWQAISNNRELLVSKITHIYAHLPHHDRNQLSSLIHHRTISR